MQATAAAAEREFTRFVKETEPRLSFALAAAYGIEVGAEATADALLWAWQNWAKVQRMRNPSGYLFRVGQSKARRYLRPPVAFPPVPALTAHHVDPDLDDALARLTKNQRVAAVMIHGLGHTEREVADVIGISRWSVRIHAERAMAKLKDALEVTVDA